MTVHLVGAGPGHPWLLTVRGAALLARADLVVHHLDAHPGVLALAPAAAERVADDGPRPDLLAERGRLGTVVRLVAGDPFLSAAAVEEARALRHAGVAYEVVAGVPSVTAAGAAAGLPLADGAVVEAGDVRLVVAGAEVGPDATAAVVTAATTAGQAVVRGALADLANVAADAVLVAGPAAADDLSWAERRSLHGLRVVVPRTPAQAAELSARLLEAGAEPVEVPAIEVVDPDDGGAALARAAGEAGRYDWVVFTSANGVERFFAALGDARRLAPARVAAIGPGTAAALAERWVRPDLVPERYVAESLLDAFPPGPGRVLLARAAVARDVLPDGLAAMGWSVDVVAAYRTVAADPTPEQLAAAGRADAICFTSSSTVTRWLEVAGGAVPPLVACIGPVTAATAREHGLAVAAEATVHTVAGLVDALVAAVR